MWICLECGVAEKIPPAFPLSSWAVTLEYVRSHTKLTRFCYSFKIGLAFVLLFLMYYVKVRSYPRTIDYECDYEMTKVIYDYLYGKKPIFLQEDILQLLEKHPEISEMNSHIKRKEGVNRTKENDRIVKKEHEGA